MATRVCRRRAGGRIVNASSCECELVRHQVIARTLGVSAGVIRLWIDTGAWPLPCAVGAAALYYKVDDVDYWLHNGRWPPGVQFGVRHRRVCRVAGLRRSAHPAWLVV